MNKNVLKRLLVLFAVLTLLMSLAPIMTLAQENGEDAEEDGTTQVVEESHEEEGNLLTPLGINGGLLVAQVVNFLLIAGLLSAFIWRPAVNMLDARTAKIQKGLEDAAAAANARQNAEAEAETVMTEARSERAKVLDEARQAGEEVKKSIEGEAREEAERIREEARQEAVNARNTELADLRDQVLKISTAVAGRILREELDDDKQSQLISNFFTQVPDSAKNLGGDVEVVSAMPLSDDEKSQVEGEISADSYTYTVEPEILGGLIVRSDDRVIDGSVRSSLNDVTSRLK
jgi:F-type H+-transporting ATPase subunit b